jgi:predicted acetyltransferase
MWSRAFTDPTWAAWLMTVDQHPAGFAVVLSLDQSRRTISSFFVVRPVRGCGLGTAMATKVVRTYPGPWQVAYQDADHAAARFSASPGRDA